MVDGHWIVITEGVDADEHFVDEDSEAPPVNRLAVAFLQKNLRSKVLGCSAERVGLAVYELGEAEVSQLQVTLFVDQQVFRLKVSWRLKEVTCI